MALILPLLCFLCYYMVPFTSVGQFSQVVWRDTEEMGMGKAFSDDGRCIIVTNYFPSGNVVGYYPYNVLPPIDGKIIMPGEPLYAYKSIHFQEG